MAPPRLTPTHSGSLGMAGVLGFWFGFSFPKIGVLMAIVTRVKTFLPYRYQRYFAKTGLAIATASYLKTHESELTANCHALCQILN